MPPGPLNGLADMPQGELTSAELLRWRDVSADTRKQVHRAARMGSAAVDARVATAVVQWSGVQSRRLAVAQRTLKVVAFTAVGLAVLTTFKVIPPLGDLRPRWGSVTDYVAWWLIAIATATFRGERWAAKRRRRMDELRAVNAESMSDCNA